MLTFSGVTENYNYYFCFYKILSVYQRGCLQTGLCLLLTRDRHMKVIRLNRHQMTTLDLVHNAESVVENVAAREDPQQADATDASQWTLPSTLQKGVGSGDWRRYGGCVWGWKAQGKAGVLLDSHKEVPGACPPRDQSYAVQVLAYEAAAYLMKQAEASSVVGTKYLFWYVVYQIFDLVMHF